MDFNKINISQGESYFAFRLGEVERTNPIEFFKEYHIKSKTFIYSDLISSQAKIENKSIPFETILSVSYQDALKWWEEHLSKIKEIEIPSQIKELFKTNKKSVQEALLKDFKLTSFDLLAYIFYAYENEGFTFSQYEGEHDPVGTDQNKKPNFIHLDGEKITIDGETDYTNGQLKQIVNQRKRTVGKILDKGDEWHCFFITYGSLRGDENWKGGQPHFHYLSDKFGHSRDHVVKQLQSRKYGLGNLPHLEFNYNQENNCK